MVFSKILKSRHTFGLILGENLIQSILKNVQSGHTGLTNTTMGNCCNPKEEPNEKLPKYFTKKKPKMYFFTCQILPGQDAVGVTTAGCFVGLWTGIERVAADATLASVLVLNLPRKDESVSIL